MKSNFQQEQERKYSRREKWEIHLGWVLLIASTTTLLIILCV